MRPRRLPTRAASALVLALSAVVSSPRTAPAQPTFINWETPPVHPIEIVPGGATLLVTNLPDNRLELINLASGTPAPLGSIFVGLDPVSVRARTATEVWVVNQISDSISIIDLPTRRVVRTLKTADEPCDVVFAGTPQRAFVSCAGANLIQVFDPANTAAAPLSVAIDAGDPRALAVSPDGSKVYAAIFFSSNASTILGGGSTMMGGFPPNAVSDPAGPYGGVNPPPNSGAAFSPAIAGPNFPPIAVGLIVKKNGAGQWMDDNNGNWTSLVSGANAARSGRPVNWDMPDRDVAIIDVASLAVTFSQRHMNIGMAIAVNPVSGAVTMVGTDATNEIRFEPVLEGKFIRVMLSSFLPGAPAAVTRTDLNPHLTYSAATVPQLERNKSIGDPRAIVWNSAGTKAYIAGMGSSNLIVIGPTGARAGLAQTIPVGPGPAGLALDGARSQLYVLNRFDGSISVVNLTTEVETTRIPFFDPTPAPIKVGRPHLYDTHKNSGLGQIACASCHVDGRNDKLAWDLGDPQGTIDPVAGNNLGANVPNANTGFENYHPMKGPMTTQTLQDIIGKEPHHWRGDRAGIEAFAPAFLKLQGDDTTLTTTEMQEFENYLASIYFPPNPSRNLDNTLPTNLPLPGQHRTGRFGSAGQPMPSGNAQNGRDLYRSATRRLDGNTVSCVACHTLPTGMGTDYTLTNFVYTPIPLGPLGQHHLMLVAVDGSTNVSMKVPQLRNMHKKTGFTLTQTISHAGFGYLHDGSIDTLTRFISEPAFNPANDQEVADIAAFMMSFSGSGLPLGSPTNIVEPPGPLSNDTHAAVGTQVTLEVSPAPVAQTNILNTLITQANSSKIGLIAKGRIGNTPRGWKYNGGSVWQSDRAGQVAITPELLALGGPGTEITFTAVPFGSQTRIGIDRDLDGCLDGDEGITCGDIPVVPCSLADITEVGGTTESPGSPDGQLTVDDVIVFVNLFSDNTGCPGAPATPCSIADICGVGGPPEVPDGQLTVDDVIAFFNAFSDGC